MIYRPVIHAKTRKVIVNPLHITFAMDTFIATADGADRFEKIPIALYPNSTRAVKDVAREISDLIKKKQAEGQKCVLGLATGASPVLLYNELVRLHKEEGLSFKNVVTFNLDEYFPMAPESIQSYHWFMNHHLFSRIDIDPANVHIPDGNLKKADVPKMCEDYEKAIEEAGGLDLQILGIGRTGHIGFNEPGSLLTSKTRMVYLNDVTRKDAAKDFGGLEKVPSKAVTMGVSTIMKAKRIIIMAWGEKKAPIVQRTVEGEVSDKVPATFLQTHPNVTFVIDEKAADELVRTVAPWLVCEVEWTRRMVRQACVWLADTVKKPVLKLVNKDYADHGLSSLLKKYGGANAVNIEVFNDLQHTITGWPGGKPNADDSTRPVKSSPHPKKVLIFSPHPDDDVISMGGTFARLVDQGHEVHVAYETSGSIAVLDSYLYQMMDWAATISKEVAGKEETDLTKAFDQVKKLIETRTPEVEPPEFLKFKKLIRQVEARNACRFIGVPPERVHYLCLPFYETGKVEKKGLSQDDVDIVVKLLREVKPNQIYCAGDLADPHGTHAVALVAVLKAFDVVCDEPWFKDMDCWWYRGAWMEWKVDKVDMAVPISPAELMLKRRSIFRHGSQNNEMPYPGDDPREFWQRAEDRNRHTADVYDKLGMAEYEAIECFARYVHKKGDSERLTQA